MTAATYDAAMIRVFADEGGYTNDPVDPGGATNWGITIIDARKYWKANANNDDVRNMQKSVAADIYREHYADPMRYDDLPAGFDYSVLDAAINSGVGRAPIWAGRSLGLAAKSINDVVVPANAAPDKVAIIQKYWSVRLSFLRGIGTFWRFGKGWTRRCTNGEAAAVRMWLSIGLKLPAPDARKKMDIEAKKAKDKAQKHGTGAATTGTGTTIGTPSLDWSHLSLGGRVMLCLAIAVAIAAIVYFVRQAIIHNQRAAAYAAA
jgi:lysozyme family protein